MNPMTKRITAPVTVSVGTIEYREFDLPEIGPRDTLLKMKLAGVCGTDVHLFHGDWNPAYPLIQGHEIFGEVADIGSEAAKKHNVKPGDFVNAEVLIPCNDCYFCERGDYARCVKVELFGNITCDRPPHLWGGFAPYLYIPYNTRIHKFPKDVIPEAAVLIEPLGTAIRACKRSNVTIGTSTVVIGPGPIGLVSVVAAKAYGAEPVILIGTRDDRLALGKELGADYTIKIDDHSTREEVAERVREYVDDHELLAEVVLEAAGTVEAQKMGLGLLRPTGVMTIMGATGTGKTVQVDTYYEILLGEQRVQGSNLSGWAYEPAVSIINSKRFPLEKIVTHTFPPSELKMAIEYSANRIENAIKVVIKHE
jgi:threonine dehydrogenase-like Zn-dependent dehydrogenase